MVNISIQNSKFKDKMNSADIKQLCKDVEEHAGLHLESKRDYIKLAELISQALNEPMSYSTLMRLWGYRISFSRPSAHSLSVLARYCGYDSFTAYCNELHNRGCESAFTLSPLSVLSNSLKVGTLLRLTWQPNRECYLRYLGNMQYSVLYVENAKLPQGSVLTCPMLAQGEPFYADKVTHNGSLLGSYVAGRDSGIHFEFVQSNTLPKRLAKV